MPSVEETAHEGVKPGELLDPRPSIGELESVLGAGPKVDPIRTEITQEDAARLRAMTKEQAAEEILRGRPWLQCDTCKGKAELQIHDEFIGCAHCGGGGYFVRPGYLFACIVLNLEMPTKPLSTVEKKAEIGKSLGKAIKLELSRPSAIRFEVLGLPSSHKP